METLKDELKCDVCAELIFEFLINGYDYTPFTLSDLKFFSRKIENWDECMKWGIIKGVDFIEYAESMIHEKLREKAYIKCMRFSSERGNIKMLKYFEPKGTYKDRVWAFCISECSRSDKYMISREISKENTLEVFKYIHQKLKNNARVIYMNFIRNGRTDVLEYIWNEGYDKRRKRYIEAAAESNQLEILKWIELRIPKDAIKWDHLIYYCSLNGSIDTYKYCELRCKDPIPYDSYLWNVASKGYFEMFKYIILKYEESKCDKPPRWNTYLFKVVPTGNFEMFKYIIGKREESKCDEELNWEGYMINISKESKKFKYISETREDFLKNGFNMFEYCSKRAKSPNYLKCMLNAMLIGLHQIVSFCEERLSPDTKIDWEECMCKAVASGIIGYIKYIESRTKVRCDRRKYVRHAAYWNSLRSLKYIEEKMNINDKSIDWKELMKASKERTQKETEVTVYIQIKLEE